MHTVKTGAVEGLGTKLLLPPFQDDPGMVKIPWDTLKRGVAEYSHPKMHGPRILGKRCNSDIGLHEQVSASLDMSGN